jgi:hypothetical protein
MLELEETDGGSITGQLADEAGNATDFTGWTGLVGALGAALEQTRADDGAQTAAKESSGDSQAVPSQATQVALRSSPTEPNPVRGGTSWP